MLITNYTNNWQDRWNSHSVKPSTHRFTVSSTVDRNLKQNEAQRVHAGLHCCALCDSFQALINSQVCWLWTERTPDMLNCFLPRSSAFMSSVHTTDAWLFCGTAWPLEQMVSACVLLIVSWCCHRDSECLAAVVLGRGVTFRVDDVGSCTN